MVCAYMYIQVVVDAEADIARAHFCILEFSYESSLLVTNCSWGADEFDKRQDLF